jgi:hypothetical protein
VTGFAGVLALVLAQTVAGGTALTWLSPLWGETKRSYFWIYGLLMTILFALPAWMTARSAALPGDAAAAWAVRLLLAALVLTALSTVLLLARLQAPGRIAGIASVPVAAASLVAVAETGDASLTLALVQVVSGAAFLGAAYDGLFLGHWYLTDRKLTRRPIDRYTIALIVASVAEIVAIAIAGFGGGGSTTSMNPILTAGDVAPWIAIGMAAATLLIAAMAKAALRGERASAVQSATGFYYLAVVTAFTAEIAVKTRFFPG